MIKFSCDYYLKIGKWHKNNFIVGTDSGKFDWMKVRTREGDIMQCRFYEQLDNTSEEIGRECNIM